MEIGNRKKDLGGKIREARKAAKLSQEKLGQLIDVRKDYISRLENGYINPSFEFLWKLADALNIDIKLFL